MAAKKRPHIDHLPPQEAEALLKRLDIITRDFTGQFDELETAIGMLITGRLLGWRVIALIHNKRTIRKYEEILGISIREEFPEEGPLVGKSPAYKLLKQLGQYWKGVSGEVKVDNKRDLVEA